MQHRWIVTVAIVFSGMVMSGCEDKSMVNIYDKSILKTPPKCLALSVIPEDKAIEKAIRDRYQFDPKCPWRLDVSFKNGIHCNSNQNSGQKALTAFPSSYLRMEIRQGMRLSYSYYIDLPQRADSEDAKRGMVKIIDDLFEK